MLTRYFLVFALIFAGAVPVRAHHAMEFIETESYSTARAGETIFYMQYDYMAEDKNDPRQDHWEFTPGIAYGITDRLMADVHFHYAKFENGLVVEERQKEFEPHGPSPFLEAFALSLQYRLTEGAPIDVAFGAKIELPMSRAKSLLDSEESYAGTLILARNFSQHGIITLNLTAGWEGDEDFQEFALGIKNSISADPHGPAAGIEFLGSFDDFDDSWTLLPGIYVPIGSPQTILKTGIEFGRDMNYTRMNVSLMYRF